MINLPEFDIFTQPFADLEKRPLLVQAILKPNSPVVAYHPPPYLDNLLARAVVDRVTNGAGLPDSQDGYWLPLPLKMAWLSPDGFPLWNSSVFYPTSGAIQDVVYTHKRPPKAIFSEAKSIKFSTGRWMERRLPIPISISSVWEARCIGNLEVILDLLKDISFLGRLRSIGMGEIDEWKVVPAEFETALVIDGQLAHGIPNGCGIECDIPMTRVGWTPPQWKVSLHSQGWAVGIPRKIDWFAETP